MDFEQVLRNTLASVNNDYDVAHSDLADVVGKIRDALSTNVGDSIGLELKRVAADIKSTTFRLYVDPNPNDPDVGLVTVTHLRLPSTGYPIKWGGYAKSLDRFNEAGELADKDALIKFFGEQLSQPESSLVQAIGFALRQRS